ncbi:unnamed protein product [Sphagnum balticum]
MRIDGRKKTTLLEPRGGPVRTQSRRRRTGLRWNRYAHSPSCDQRELRGSRTSGGEDRVRLYAEIVVKFVGLGKHKFSGSEAERRKA